MSEASDGNLLTAQGQGQEQTPDQAQEQAQEQAHQLRRIFDHANDAILLIDPEHYRILDANAQASRMLGYDPTELTREVRISSVHPHEMERLLQFAQDVKTRGQGWTDELSCMRKDGLQLPSEISASVVQVDGRDCIIAMVRDVSARKVAEEALRRSEARFRAFVENAGDGFFLVASDGRILDTNTRAAEMLGYARADALVGRSVLEIDVGLTRELLPALQALPSVADRRLQVDLGLPETEIQADPAQLREVLINLVVNACEAEASGEPVTLCSGRQPGTTTPMIEVRNGGEPIPPQVLARIGQPFFSTKDAGNGLGVAYVRRVAAAHHWTFSLESTAGTGTIARLLL